MRLIRLLVIVITFIPAISFAISRVTVKSEYAIVYADIELKTAIGKISIGKEIVVGSPNDPFAKAIPIIISGRVAYVHIDDVTLADPLLSKQDKQNDDNRVSRSIELAQKEDEIHNAEDIFLKNNHVGFEFGSFAPRADWESVSQKTGTTEMSISPFYRLLIEHRPPNKSYSFSVGLGYYLAEEETSAFEMYTGELAVSYLLLNNKLISIGPTLGLFYSGNFSVQYKNDPNSPYTGVAYGFLYGIRGIIFPQSKISFTGGYSIIDIRPSSLREMTNPVDGNRVELNQIISHSLYLGINYKFN